MERLRLTVACPMILGHKVDSRAQADFFFGFDLLGACSGLVGGPALRGDENSNNVACFRGR
jgi:hypothetical protein